MVIFLFNLTCVVLEHSIQITVNSAYPKPLEFCRCHKQYFRILAKLQERLFGIIFLSVCVTHTYTLTSGHRNRSLYEVIYGPTPRSNLQ
uniref:Secreted protein n=1 Tax=Octopus bimaculoides TaxID=37653 RepID=A0A0L8GQ93_OCTBM